MKMQVKPWALAALLATKVAGQDVVYDYVIAGAGTAGLVGS